MSQLQASDLISLATSYWNSATLMAAVRLKAFDALQTPQTLEQFAEHIQSNSVACEALLIALISLSLVEKQDNLYQNTAVANDFLVSSKPQALNQAMLYNADVYPLWGQLDQVIKQGDVTKDPQAYLGEDEAKTQRFVYGMHHRALGIGQAMLSVIDLSQAQYLMDIGGGPGTYSVLLTKKYKHLKADVLDLPAVVRVASQIVQQMNGSDQVQCTAYDYYKDELPQQDYDSALISGVLHREQPPQVQKIFQQVAQRLPIGGQLWISDVMLNDDRTGPLFSAMFTLNMRILSHDGRCHSVAEQTQWLQEAGFKVTQVHQLPAPIHYTVIAAERIA